MKKKINNAIEKVSREPLERFGLPTIFGGAGVAVLSFGLIVYCLKMPLLVRHKDAIARRSLGSLLWKARTNR